MSQEPEEYFRRSFKKYFTCEGRGGGRGVKKVTQVGEGAAKKVITVTQILWVSVFVQLSFFSSVSHEVLIILH